MHGIKKVKILVDKLDKIPIKKKKKKKKKKINYKLFTGIEISLKKSIKVKAYKKKKNEFAKN